ncbi:MAG: VWA domain-containing protein [Deltaproteobacteria bacterium]|nr:VWA domain-containing protein [Deltaproteobacteria bacterium]
MLDGWTFTLLGYKARLLHPEYGLLLAAVVFGGIALFLAAVGHAARVRRIIPTRLMPRVLPGYSPARRYLRLGSGLFSGVLISLALMQPQCGSGSELARKVGIDVVVALDVSRSMLARDVKPSRLDRARLELTDLIDHLDGDRFGLVIFAGTAFVQCPMTTDYAAAKLFLRAVDASQMPTQGTNLSAALGAAAQLLSSREGARGKVVILLTDGEDHSGRALEAAKTLAETGARIFTVGIGSPGGEPIPIVSKHGDIIGYKKDDAGNTILSRLDEEGLKALAEAGKGVYVAAGTAGAGIDQVIERMEEMEKTEFEARLTTRYEDQSAVFLVPAFLFLVLSMIIRPGSRPRPPVAARGGQAAKPAARGAKAAALLPFLLLASAPLLGGWRLLESEDPAVEAGNQAYARGDYDDAVKAYDDALGRLSRPEEGEARARVQFNKGTALAAKGEMDSARKELQAALAGADDGLKATDFYNLGTGLLTTGDPKGAADAFIRSLQIDPANAAARHNLELALRALKKEEQPPEKQDESSDQKEQQESEQSQDESDQQQEKEQAEQKEEQEGEGQEQQDEQDSQGEQQDESEGQSKEQEQDAEQEGQDDQSREQQEGEQGDQQQQEQQGEGEQQEKGQPEQGGGQEESARQQQQEEQQGESPRPDPEEQEGEPMEVKEAQAGEEGGDQKAPAKGAIASEEAERILDALSRGEKPLQMQLFRVGEYEEEEPLPGGKDW